MTRVELYRRVPDVEAWIPDQYERDEQAEADAALGLMLREMPPKWNIFHTCFTPDEWRVYDKDGFLRGAADTPDAALAAALGVAKPRELATKDKETEQ